MKIDLNGGLDPAMLGNFKYYGNARKRPNRHCKWISKTILPGWYETIAHQNKRLRAKLKARMATA